MIFHKLYRLNKSNVIDNEITKLVIGPDSVYLFLYIVEKLEVSIRKNYGKELFDFARSLYDEKELIEKGTHKEIIIEDDG